MEGDIKKKQRIEGLIGSWIFCIFWWFFFGIIGIVVAGWFSFYGDWWITFVGGIILIGAISESIRFSARRLGRRKRLESLIGSWSIFFFFVLLFCIVAMLLAGWWPIRTWWAWFIIGIMLIGAVSSTIRFFAYPDVVEPVIEEVTSIVIEEAPKPIKEAINYCQSCGQKVSPGEKYCQNCGAPIE